MQVWKNITKNIFVSNEGVVAIGKRREAVPIIMMGGNTKKSPKGKYPYVKLDYKVYSVHSLVAKAFIGLKPDGLVVCHNDGNTLNTNADNLRYDTLSNNMKDRIRHGTAYKLTNKMLNKMFKLVSSGDSVNNVARLFGTGRHWTLIARNRAKEGKYTMPSYAKSDNRTS